MQTERKQQKDKIYIKCLKSAHTFGVVVQSWGFHFLLVLGGSPLALLTFWTGEVFFGAFLLIVGCLITSLAFDHRSQYLL